LKIQFFDPFSNIWSHSFPVARVMAGFSELGHDVEVVRCTGTFSTHCAAMSASNIGYQSSTISKKLVCRACRKRSEVIDGSEIALSLKLDDEIEPNDLATVNSFVEQATLENWSSLEYEGVPVGKIASYEILLTHKIDSVLLPDSVWPEFQASLANTVLVVIIAKRILTKSRPDRVIVYNSLYALNNAYTNVADMLGIPTFTVQGGPHITRRPFTLTCFASPNDMFLSTYSKEASDWLLEPSNKDSIILASEHLQNLLLGESAFAYSVELSKRSKAKLSKEFALNSKRPVLVALLSSEDELFAANLVGALPKIDSWHNVFDSQTEWIKWLTEFALRNPDLDIVIRVHPRLMPNKRESKVAPYVTELQNVLSIIPSNIKVNWPSDGISLYDLMQHTDVVLNRRSSAGLEMMAYGLPVVLAGDEFLFSCPPEICLVAKDSLEYEELIFKAINEGWSLDNVRRAYRWLAFVFRSTTVDVIEGKESWIPSIRPKKSQIFIKIWRWLTFVYLQSGITQTERSDIINVRQDLQSLDRLIQTVTDVHAGIHIALHPKSHTVSDFNLETDAIITDLENRLSLMRISDTPATPLIEKFYKAKIENFL